MGSSCSKDPSFPMAFGGAVVKDSVREGAAGCMISFSAQFLDWLASR